MSTVYPVGAPSDLIAESSTFPGGAGLIIDGSGWFLADEAPERSLGRALAWAHKNDVEDLNVIVNEDGGVVARRAAQFARAPRVFRVDGGTLVSAEIVSQTPIAEPPSEALDLVPLLAEAGVEIVIEHGVVRGEILGLEVARIVIDPVDGPRVEVGVGRHDREAFAMVHGDVPAPKALASVVESVRLHRCAGPDGGLPEHPLGRMASERWLRKVLVDQPERIGTVALEAVESIVERERVDEAVPAIAVGTGASGAPVVVVCSTGIDLDLVPTAADARITYGPEADLLLVLPERDAHPVTRTLSDALTRPGAMIAVSPDWRSW